MTLNCLFIGLASLLGLAAASSTSPLAPALASFAANASSAGAPLSLAITDSLGSSHGATTLRATSRATRQRNPSAAETAVAVGDPRLVARPVGT